MRKKIRAADLFCGAGGMSLGLWNACQKAGLKLELVGINHNPLAIDTHSTNLKFAEHLCANLDSVDPRKVVPGGVLDILLASPECTQHSRAKGGKPINDQSRVSAFQVLRWLELLNVHEVQFENVPEWRDWAPIDAKGRPIKTRKGEVYQQLLSMIAAMGYHVEERILCSADYGDPTTRERLFVRASRKKIVWPEPTHMEKPNLLGQPTWRPFRDCIEFDKPGTSIFEKKLVPNTIRRIEEGLRRFSGQPFVLSGSSGGAPRKLTKPVMTLTAHGETHLIQAFLLDTGFGGRTRSVDDPAFTLTTQDSVRLIEAFLIEYYGTGGAESIDKPLHTLTTKDRFALVQPILERDGKTYKLEILHRFITDREAARAMGFPDWYEFKGGRDAKMKQIGNAVSVGAATALCDSIIQNNILKGRIR